METSENVLWILVYLVEQARGSYKHAALYCAPQSLGTLSALGISCGLLCAFLLTLFSSCCHEQVEKSIKEDAITKKMNCQSQRKDFCL